MGIITAIANEKGGSKKTSTTFMVGKELAKRGLKVLLIDHDPQGNLTYALTGEQKAETHLTQSLYNEASSEIDTPLSISPNLALYCANKRLSVIAARGAQTVEQLAQSLAPIKSGYDHILIDCLPSMGLVYLACIRAADYVCVTMETDGFNVQGLEQIIESLLKAKQQFANNVKLAGILFNAVERNSPISKRIMNSVCQKYKEAVFNNVIPKSDIIKSVLEYNEVVRYENLKQNNPIVQSYAKVVDELLERVNNGV